MEPVNPAQVDFEDPARVATIMAALSQDAHVLSLRLDDDEDPREFTIERLSVSPGRRPGHAGAGRRRVPTGMDRAQRQPARR